MMVSSDNPSLGSDKLRASLWKTLATDDKCESYQKIYLPFSFFSVSKYRQNNPLFREVTGAVVNDFNAAFDAKDDRRVLAELHKYLDMDFLGNNQPSTLI